MTDPRTAAAKAWGITYTPATASPGQGVWRCISVDGPVEWGGRVSTYVETLGAGGVRVVGLPVRWFWAGNDFVKPVEAKTGEPFGIDFPMSAGGNSYGVQIADGQPSDTVFGFGMGHFVRHHVFKVIYRYTIAGDVPTEPPAPPEPPVGEVTLLGAIDQAQRWLDIARGLL